MSEGLIFKLRTPDLKGRTSFISTQEHLQFKKGFYIHLNPKIYTVVHSAIGPARPEFTDWTAGQLKAFFNQALQLDL